MSQTTIIGWVAAARFLGCSKAHVRRLVADGRLAAEQDEVGRHHFAQDELANLRTERRVTTAQTPPPQPRSSSTHF